jgi:hypothetical protein
VRNEHPVASGENNRMTQEVQDEHPVTSGVNNEMFRSSGAMGEFHAACVIGSAEVRQRTWETSGPHP